MSLRPLPLPRLVLALGLGTLTLGVWLCLMFLPGQGVRVVNHSGQLLRDVRVCLASGPCVTRTHLWPHDAWRVPLRYAHDNAVTVSTPGYRAQAYVTNGAGVRFVLRQNGAVRIVN